MTETLPGSKEAVLAYIRARQKRDQTLDILMSAKGAATLAENAMQVAWRHCSDAAPGVYSFAECGRVCVLVSPFEDYPALTRIVE